MRLKRVAAGLTALAAFLLLLWALWPDADENINKSATNNVANSSSIQHNSTVGSPFQSIHPAGAGFNPNSPLTPEAQRTRQQQIDAARQRYERAEHTYNSYRDATRYPHDSRPAAEHADRNRPFDPVSEDKTMRGPTGEPVKGVKLRTGQSHVFLSGGDTAKFTVQALDDTGKVLPLVITRAAAQTVPDSRQLVQLRSANLEFSDAGAAASGGADTTAGDGEYSARLSPQTQGFAGAAGTIRVLVFVKADGKEGVAHYDIIYTEDTPATWVEPGIREAQESGSLNFYVKANIRTPGRYVVTGRVDDANGQALAHLSFNEELQAGQREFKLHLFGALIRDKRPVFPLKLRDIEGFLLIPDKFPDRLMLARRAGSLFTSRSYSLESFSDAEWSSEERARYLAEYGKDLDRAREDLSRLVK
jgi:hypothetical protein